MKQLNIIKGINSYFLENWNKTEIQFFTPDSFEKTEESFIFVKYIPVGTEYKFLGGTEGRASIGILRVFCYAKNPTLCLELLDEVFNFICDKKIPENICIEEGRILQSPERVDASKLFLSAIDFDVSLLGY